MRIIAIDPGTKKVGYLVMDGKKLLNKGIIPYKNFKHELITLMMLFKFELCILEKGGVTRSESKIKRILNSKNIKYIEYESAKVREELGLFDMGIDNQNKRYLIKKYLGFKEYNRDIMDAALLIIYHYKTNKKGE